MRHVRPEAELATLRKLAQQLATTRKETLTTVHLLAAMAGRESAAAELLRERRLDQEALLKATRSFDEESPDPIGLVIAASRAFVRCGPSPEPGALHLLLALLANRRCAAHRALVQCGVDVARLRSSAMQQTLGMVAPRRTSALAHRGRTEVVPAPPRRSDAPGVAVPWIPPPRVSPPSSPPEAIAVVPPLPRRGAPRRVSPAAKPQVALRVVPPEEPMSLRFELDPKRCPTLIALGRNLTLMASTGELAEIVGREAEVDRALDVLARRDANSPCLVGPPGVGKTSVARAIAHHFAASSEPTPRLLIELTVAELVSGMGARGALAERFAAIRAEAREMSGQVVLFIDELHELFSGGWAEEAAGELKLALARQELSIVATTTQESFRRIAESDAMFARRLSVVEIEPPSEEEAFFLLQSVAADLGRHHRLGYSDEAIAAAISWSIRYLPGRALPDKAVGVLDLAGARSRRRGKGTGGPSVDTDGVAEVVAELANIPIERLLETDRDRMLALESIFAKSVVGHSEELGRIATILRRNAAGLRSGRPIGSFLLLGPTGVGKTETAKAIAQALFHSPDAMTRLDLSEYAEPHAIARLVGAPPGYVGHEAGGQLTEAVRRRPYQVILLDEIEKAHRDVLEAFLQVFDEGRMTDGRGRLVDFTNTVIVLTSNLGAMEANNVQRERPVGFAQTHAQPSRSTRAGEAMIAAAKLALPPELYNRLDEVLCYARLTRGDVTVIASRLLEQLEGALSDRGIQLQIEESAIDVLLESGGFDPDYGARPMKRAIARLIEAPLAEMILRGELKDGSVALVSGEAGKLVIDSLPAAQRGLGHASPLFS